MTDITVKLPELLDTENTEDSLHWHALNYRCAHTIHAEACWQTLEEFVKRYAAAAVLADRDARAISPTQAA